MIESLNPQVYVDIFKLVLAVVLGGIIGLERQIIHRPAGLRTHMLVSLGACIFMIISQQFNMDPARIAAGVVTGVGFIGAGTIIAERRGSNEIVRGITTAASLWATSGVGMLIGLGNFILAVLSTILITLILWFGKFEGKICK
jgi:putative Mg2+ transporter-C (MgtC) family protein